MAEPSVSRLVVAGMAGESGKTLVSLALLVAARTRGLTVQAFKKGPDFIDPAWLTWASGQPARNLDTFLMRPEGVRRSFARHACDGLNLIEGDGGLFDGLDAQGTHSTAELAKLLRAPVLLMVDCTKATRTVAASVLGCQALDPAVRLAGVVLNRVGGERHEAIVREAIDLATGIPTVGVLRRQPDDAPIAKLRRGAGPPTDDGDRRALHEALVTVASSLDMDAILPLAGVRDGQQASVRRTAVLPAVPVGVRIGYLADAESAFGYADNLEAIEAAGATLVPVAGVSAPGLPEDLDGLYLGGGFPESQVTRLGANRAFLRSIAAFARAGRPIYAECGGLILLARRVTVGSARHPMAGVFPFAVVVEPRPQGHGYVELVVDRANPYFPVGAVVRGYEFHFSRIDADPAELRTLCAVRRGVGLGGRRDAVALENVWASYTHLHAGGVSGWAPAFVAAAGRRRTRVARSG
jgi:cobyrinic acid a,c-diamide synthase